MTTSQWRSRIVGHGEADPATLTPNVANWRLHPSAQIGALTEVLDRVGWVQDVIVNKRTGRIVDGHARVEAATARGDASVPVVYVDLDEDDERLVLATFDPLGALAERDEDALSALLSAVNAADGDLGRMLADLRPIAGDQAVAPTGFPSYDEDIETEHRCPKCGYEWSGGQ